MKDLIMHSTIAEITPEDFTHPGLRMVKFIFCDNQPNENGQGIAEEDFEDIMKTGVGTPIKMKFFGTSAGGHLGSIPIGYIKNMVKVEEGDVKRLVADAILFADEYPDEVEYLAHSFAEGQAPGVSWELRYSDSLIKDGIEWLKGLVTRAATFVRHPAYGNRTAILALASNREISDEDFNNAFRELIDTSPKNTEQGGNNRMDEELQKLRDQIAALETTVSEKDTAISNLTSENETLKTTVSEKETVIAEFQHKELVASRTNALVEAGITLPTEPEKLAAKQEFFVGLSEEAFETYKTDLAEVIASASKVERNKEGFASLRKTPTAMPRFDASAGADDQPTSFSDLRNKFKGISRVSASAESE